jgi:hypothetical protein
MHARFYTFCFTLGRDTIEYYTFLTLLSDPDLGWAYTIMFILSLELVLSHAKGKLCFFHHAQ